MINLDNIQKYIDELQEKIYNQKQEINKLHRQLERFRRYNENKNFKLRKIEQALRHEFYFERDKSGDENERNR